MLKARFINKEISWLAFNARVLQEAGDRTVPLVERLRFLGIFSSNLDEFFRIRVAGLKRLANLGKRAVRIIGHDPRLVLKEIETIVIRQQRDFDDLFKSLLVELADENIFIVNEKEIEPEHASYLTAFFHQYIQPRLVPIMLNQARAFPHIRDYAIYLALCLSRGEGRLSPHYALVEIPTDVISRFVLLPEIDGRKFVMLLDDAIRHGLHAIFSALPYSAYDAYTFKITRDAELDMVDDLSQSYVTMVQESLKRRKGGAPVRFNYDAGMPPKLLDVFIRKLKLKGGSTLIPGGRYHNFRDFMSFPNLGGPHLAHAPIMPLAHKGFLPNQGFLKSIRRRDILLHYPYHSFSYVIDILRDAAIDPKVISIKITLYRLARSSSIVNALISAARNGKKVTVVLELQARFDEEANISWANKLKEEGIRVIFGVPGLKVHSKLCLITRHEGDEEGLSAMLGTGNFNEATARVYSDHYLFTTDRRLTAEVKRIFDFFDSNHRVPALKHLIVSPFNMRREFYRLIDNEIRNAKKGRPAGIHFKLNNLVDAGVIERLYKAGRAGVPVRLNVRGMFSLVPGIAGLSETISGVRIVDQYLEHSRIYLFCNNGDEKLFISSADLMQRNLDRRVEVTCPIYDAGIRKELLTFLDIQWRDNVKACILDASMTNGPKTQQGDEMIRAQTHIMQYLTRLHGQTDPKELPR